ncbi:MAG: hypothetical protein OXU51_09740 [Candidatus Poribacteria bacterium]|nr:hypothetical protein [Candidatus Poribacteria bacterium]
MRLYPILLGLFVLVCVSLGQAQTVLDSPGATSSLIFLFPSKTGPIQTRAREPETVKGRKAGNFLVNQADGSAKVSYIWEDKWQKGESWNMRFGFDVRGKVTNGYLRLFDSEKIAPELKGNFFLGWHTDKPEQLSTPTSSSSVIVNHAFLLGMGYSHGEYRLLQTNANPVDDRTLRSPLVGGYYNLRLKTQPTDRNVSALDIRLGFCVGYTWNDNNYRELTASEVTLTKDLASTEDKAMPVQKQKFTALVGENQEFNAWKFNMDVVLEPSVFDGKFGMLFFVNCTLRDNGESVVAPGAGLFFPASPENKTKDSGSKPNILSKVDKAVMFQYDTRSDISNQGTLGFVGTYRF